MIKIRITGLPNEVTTAVEQIQKTFRVLAVSPPYPNRNSEYVRVYLEADAKTGEFVSDRNESEAMDR